MQIFINVLAAAAFLTGWFSTREGDPHLGATMFGVSMGLFAASIVAEKRNMGNRLLDCIALVMATFGLASSVFILWYESAKRAAGQ